MPTLAERLTYPDEIALPPAHLGLKWEPLQAAHAPEVAELVRDCQRYDGAIASTSDAELADMIEGGRGQTVIKAIVGFDHHRKPQALAAVRVPTDATKSVHATLEASIAPTWRGRGIGRVVLVWQDHTARKIIHETYGDQSTIGVEISAIVQGNNDSARSLFVAAGYTPERTFDVMYADLARPIVTYQLSPDYEFASFPVGDEREKVRQLHLETFNDHWGDQRDFNDWWESAMASLDLRWSTIVREKATGEIAGYAVVARPVTRWMLTGIKELYAELVGVSRKHRGKGLARAMLSYAVETARADGMQRFGLDVDVDNPSGAGQIYTQIGFEPLKNFTYYTVEL
ncbi:hypothetical protein BK816_04745 [Boudabousia tangfeifanii]|uniref:N-acetyltransferase domain-containing protein n=1 Tax=Boudabousia tangfeifanii TaxID=1912795 RepID=A0A1D9MKI1_9ACTO|nr:GNAT family N-acetyltransferase [Boudabousia tangfeifanii]AOZ72683.1 hypothetical protein BK816_04745 [Boudabousia tangfeifanii]